MLVTSLSRTKANDRISLIFLVMKITTALLLLGALHVSANSLSQTITLNAKDKPIKQIFEAIYEQTQFGVIYNDQKINPNQKVTVVAQQMPLEAFLQEVLSSRNLSYRIMEQTIFVQAGLADVTLNNPTEPGKVAQRTVTGTVRDEQGNPLEGVTVKVKGTPYGTTTDSDGNYQLAVPAAGSVLEFTFLGYEPAEIAIGAESTIDITMEPSLSDLDEIVVIGYGAQKREMVTSSIATVKSDAFNKGVISDPLTLIAGKVSGLSITRPNGADPNAEADYSLRGAVSVEGNPQPLIVIDGVPGADIRSIAPGDIESVDVLRDGSAGAIYGSRANAGVIIITTKRGVPGATRVSYSGYASTETIAKKYDVLTGDDFREQLAALGGDVSARDKGSDTDWFDQLTRTPTNHGHNLSLSGGYHKTTFNATLNYQKFEGIDLATRRELINGRLHLNTKALDDKLDFSLMLANTYEDKSFAHYYGFGQALKINPTYPVYDENGDYFESPEFGDQWNPLADTRLTTNDQKEKRLLGTVNLKYAISPSLTAGVNYSLTKTDLLGGSYTNTALRWMQISGLNGQASRSVDNTTNNILETTLAFDEDVNDHHINAVAGYSYQNEFNEGVGAGNNNFLTDVYSYYNLGAGGAIFNYTPGAQRGGVFVSSYAQEQTLLSYFARVIYDYKDRYLLNGSIRREGASKFGKDHKWGTFWALSGGWILSREGFMDGVGAVKNLKLRAGYGVTGNQHSLQPYQSLATIGRLGRAYLGMPGGGYWLDTYGPDINSNPDLRWETKKELNVGVDFTLFSNGWLSGAFDYYNRKISALVGNYYAQVPAAIWPLIFANAGELVNEGLELTLNGALVKNESVDWQLTLVSAYNRNEVTSISSEQFQGTAHDVSDIGVGNIQRIVNGQPIGVYYGRRYAGLTEEGKWLFLNSAGESVTADEISGDDYVYLGNSIPKFNVSLTNNLTYKRFDLSVLLRSALGFKAVNANRIFHENRTTFPSSNVLRTAFDTPLNDAPLFSDYYLENGSYLKIDNVTLGYSIPLKGNSQLKKLRVSATATNLFTITGFSGMDPELGINTFNYPGIEQNSNYYPRTRSFTFGVAADF